MLNMGSVLALVVYCVKSSITVVFYCLNSYLHTTRTQVIAAQSLLNAEVFPKLKKSSVI